MCLLYLENYVKITSAMTWLSHFGFACFGFPSLTVLTIKVGYNFGEETVSDCRQGDLSYHRLKPVLPRRITAGSLCAHPLDAGD